MDGIRAYWDGREMWSRHSKRILCPSWFTKDLLQDPKLDGELWMGRQRFEDLLMVLNSSNLENSRWKDVKYMVFDLPSSKEPLEARIQDLRKMALPGHVMAVEHLQSDGNDHVSRLLHNILRGGGEGLMAVKPGSTYVNGRTEIILKVKVTGVFL